VVQIAVAGVFCCLEAVLRFWRSLDGYDMLKQESKPQQKGIFAEWDSGGSLERVFVVVETRRAFQATCELRDGSRGHAIVND
jgi:hypothetical protein